MTLNATMRLSPLPSTGNLRFIIRALATSIRRGEAATDGAPASFRLPPLDPDHVAAYRTSLGFRSPGIPLTYLYLAVQRAQLGYMVSSRFPYPVPGIVHLENDMQWPGDDGVRFDSTRQARITIHPRFERWGRDEHMTCILETDLTQDGVHFAHCSSRYLVRRSAASVARRTAADSALMPRPDMVYFLEGDAGRRYADLSGDRNPIHLWTWSARLFGFQRPVIQGMHTAARMAAHAESHKQSAIRRIQASFLKPALVPCEIALSCEHNHVTAWVRDSAVARAQFEFFN